MPTRPAPTPTAEANLNIIVQASDFPDLTPSANALPYNFNDHPSFLLNEAVARELATAAGYTFVFEGTMNRGTQLLVVTGRGDATAAGEETAPVELTEGVSTLVSTEAPTYRVPIEAARTSGIGAGELPPVMAAVFPPGEEATAEYVASATAAGFASHPVIVWYGTNLDEESSSQLTNEFESSRALNLFYSSTPPGVTGPNTHNTTLLPGSRLTVRPTSGHRGVGEVHLRGELVAVVLNRVSVVIPIVLPPSRVSTSPEYRQLLDEIMQAVAAHMNEYTGYTRSAAAGSEPASMPAEEILRHIDASISTTVATEQQQLDSINASISSHEQALANLLSDQLQIQRRLENARAFREQHLETIQSELEIMRSFARLERITLSSSALTVYTKPVFVRSSTGRYHRLGKLAIKIPLNATTSDAIRVERAPGESNTGPRPAVHVHPDGKLCAGNLALVLPQLLLRRQYASVVESLLRFVHSVNTNDPFGQDVHRWPEATATELQAAGYTVAPAAATAAA